MICEILNRFVLRCFDSGQPAQQQQQQRWWQAHSWSLWDWLDGPSFIVVRMLCICLKSGQFAITGVLLVATKGQKQCWQRPAASLENHRGRNINYINRYIYINSHSAYLYRCQQCITVLYSYATLVQVQFMNMKYIIKSHRLCKSEFMLLWVLLFYVFAEVVLTINIVECSECKASFCVTVFAKVRAGFFILLCVSREPDFTQNTAGRTSWTTEQISYICLQL